MHACTRTHNTLQQTRCKRKSNRLTREQLVGMPTYTMEFFNDRVLQGEKWVIVNSAVVDVKDYMKVHPGGSKVLLVATHHCYYCYYWCNYVTAQHA
jgi:hypothetical protein